MTTSPSTQDALDELVQQWADAESHGDRVALNGLLAEDFVAVGPLGFLLDKTAWLQRYADNALHYTAFTFADTQTRQHRDIVIVVGVQTQAGSYHGSDASGRFRVTQVWVPRAPSAGGEQRRLLIAAMQLSPIAAPPSSAATG